MNKVQLYIEGQRVDLEDNEQIEVKSYLKDLKDIGKVFTDFSKPFTVPASTHNNKIFKHFYNTDVVSGFDARIRKDAEIYLNYQLYRKGKVFLEGVSMKNKVAHRYNIIFYGNTVNIKDLFGDDKLTALDLSDFDHTFGYTEVYDIFRGQGFTANSDGPGYVVSGDTESLIYPLITSKKRLFYDTTLTNNNKVNYDGNIYFSGLNTRGVSEEDLKPAIKVYYIIKAIEDKYNINFIPNDTSGTDDFFSRHNEAISNLYLWMSNSAGNITGKTIGDNYFYTAIPNSYTSDPQTDDDHFFISYDGDQYFTITTGFTDTIRQRGGKSNRGYDFKIHVDPDTGYDEVNWRVLFKRKRDDFIVNRKEGRGNEKFYVTPASGTSQDEKYYIEFQSEAPMSNTLIKFETREEGAISSDFETYRDFVDTTSKGVSANINVPDMKVIDFLDGLFKMFNLVAYYIDDESDSEYSATTPVIKVRTLDNFLAAAKSNQSGGIIDITDFVDIGEHTVNTALPFSDISFTYADNDTIVRKSHTALTGGRVFGNSTYSLNEEYDQLFLGDKYEIKVPFTILKYEHIKDEDGADTKIQWGYAAGGDFQTTDAVLDDNDDVTTPPKGDYTAQNIKPLLFYGIKVTGANSMAFIDGAASQSQSVSTYYRPSNTNEPVERNALLEFETPADYQLTFDAELDEFTSFDAGDVTNSLFSRFYKKYINSVFDADKRIYIINAFLPPKVLTIVKMNDQLKIQDTVFRINSIVTSLTTGKSKLELINLNPTEIVQ